MLDANNPEINVDEIMARIQEKVRSRRATGDRMPRLSELDRPADWSPVDLALAVANNHSQAGAALPPMSRTSGLKRLLASFIGRIVLRLAQLFTRDQRAYNRAVLDAFQAALLQLRDDGSRVGRLAAQLTQEAALREQSHVRRNSEMSAALAEASIRLDVLQRESRAVKQQLAEKLDAAVQSDAGLKENIASLRSELAAVTAEVWQQQQQKGAVQGEVAQRLVALETSIRGQDKSGRETSLEASRVKTGLILQERRLTFLSEEVRKRLPAPLDGEALSAVDDASSHLDDLMYLGFEDAFRGSREDIKRLMAADYLSRLRDANAGTDRAPILDFGCGRGELLEVARNEGLRAIGVDKNHASIEVCKKLNLDVVAGDAFKYLANVADGSLGALTAIHVVEHLPYALMLKLLDEALRVLKPGGLAIFETPNPTNLRVGACTFYLDPSHRNPVHPQTLQYLVEARGFVRVETLMLHPCSPAIHVPEEGSVIGRVFNEYFYGPQDYAVLGLRP